MSENDGNESQTSTTVPAAVCAEVSCDFPAQIRDGLLPVQYFRMTEVLVGSRNLHGAKKSFDKLRANKSSGEAQAYADLLIKTVMPKHDVPDDAWQLLKAAEDAEYGSNPKKALGLFKVLVSKYPNFELAYAGMACHYGYFYKDLTNAEQAFEKALSINPHNVEVLNMRVNYACNSQRYDKAYEYAQRILSADPAYSSQPVESVLRRQKSLDDAVRDQVRRLPPQIVPSPSPQSVRYVEVPKIPLEPKVLEVMNSYERKKFSPQIINQRGEIFCDLGPNVDAPGVFCNGLLLVRSDGRTQYWTKRGKQAFKRSFENGSDFAEGLAAVKDGQWGFIDKTGEFVISRGFEYALPFSEGLAAVVLNRNYGFVNKSGKVVIEPIYDKVKPFSDGRALVRIRDKIGFLDQSGHFVIAPEYDSGRSFSEGLAEVGFLDKANHQLRLCFIDKFGKIVIDTSKIALTATVDTKELDMFDLDDDKTVFGFERSTGIGTSKKIPRDFHCGLAGIKLGKYFGYIDQTGKVVIPPIFHWAGDFSENLATVRPGFGHEKALIDKTGKIVVAPKYQNIAPFHDGIAAVEYWENNSNACISGYINAKGEQVLPLQYYKAGNFVEGAAKVQSSPLSLTLTKAVPGPSIDKGPARSPDFKKIFNGSDTDDMLRRILAAWPTDTVCSVDRFVEFSFKLDHAGNAYDITFRDGCASAQTMMATVHSVVFGMPFAKTKNSSYLVRVESNGSGKPKISLNAVKLADEVAEDKILAGMPVSVGSHTPNLLRQEMYRRLGFLCANAALHPDSPSVRAALVKSLKEFGLNPNLAHDWLCIARGTPPSLILRRNPDRDDERSCNIVVAAVFQAWSLEKKPQILSELVDAYRYKIALDVMRARGDQSLYLGISAELMDKYSEAIAYYEQSESTSPFAKNLLKRFSRSASGTDVSSRVEVLTERDWKIALKWLPIDSELLVAILRPLPTIAIEQNRQAESMAEFMQDFVGARQLPGRDVRFAVHGGRNFHSPKEIGTGTQAGADILVFAQPPSVRDENLTHVFYKDAAQTYTHERLEGFSVVVHEIKPQNSLPIVKFRARPFANVEVRASDRHYLRQILSRIKSSPTDRAFPENLIEWKTIDLKADCVALRQFDGAYAPFDQSAPMTAFVRDESDQSYGRIVDRSRTGFTFSGKVDGTFSLKIIGTNPKSVRTEADGWLQYYKQHISDFGAGSKSVEAMSMLPLRVSYSAGGNVATVSGKTNKVTGQFYVLPLLHDLGTLVAM